LEEVSQMSIQLQNPFLTFTGFCH